MTGVLSGIARRLGFAVERYRPLFDPRTVSLLPPGVPRGTALIAYILTPFLRRAGEPVSSAHTHHGESLLMAEAFLDKGYAVDVIDYRNGDFVPRRRYDFFVSARTNLERIAARLQPGCVTIAHLDTAHFLFNNAAAYARALALQRRRGATCTSIRVVEPNRAIEAADYGALLGGEFLVGTYAYARKPLFCLPIPTVQTYPFDEQKDFEACRRRFLWFGSRGFVHKGLDLVLEAFAGMPEYELVVCGPVEEEAEFTAIYQRELYETPNVQVVGWVDVTSPRFLEITGRCVALVFPTCSESQSASSLTCMQAGLIPILSAEAGIDVKACGRLIEPVTIEEIRRQVSAVAALPVAELRMMARAAWQHARSTHTAERYTEEYGRMLDRIVAGSGALQ